MVFYFTGTGNSLYIAKELEADPVSIPQILRNGDLTFTAERIGIVCPIYGHEMPAMVKEFLEKATFHTDYFYVILTYGRRHADAVELAAAAIARAGKRADYITTLLMVDNFLPAFDMVQEMALDKDVAGQLARIQKDVREKTRAYQEVTDEDRQVHRQYLDRVNGQAETVWAKYTVGDTCVGCGVCTRVCPAGCIRVENGRAAYHQTGCQACMACIQACPQKAIHMAAPLGEANPDVHYRHPQVTLAELIAANDQTGSGQKD